MSPRIKKHRQSKFFTIMLIPDSTTSNVRSLKVPHWFLSMLIFTVAGVALVIGGLGTLNAYSKARLSQTVRIIEETENEKLEILNEKEKIEAAKKRIESNLNNQQGDFNKQIDFYLEQIAQIEARLIEIENQANESYEKMNVDGSPVSFQNAESFMGGNYSPVFEENMSRTDKLNLLIASLRVQFDTTENYIETFSEDVDKFVMFKNSLPSIWPVTGTVTSEYGGRSDPITGATASHSGIDIKVPTGTNVKAAGAGVVKRAEYSSGYGYLVVIDHGYGVETYYAHNSELLVKAGDRVNKGNYVSKSGNTGRSTGPHVHYEVRVGGAIVDPRNYLDK